MLALDHERSVRPRIVRAAIWLPVAVIVLGTIGAVGGDRPTPVAAAIAAVFGLVLLVVAVASGIADWATRSQDGDRDDQDRDELDEAGPDGAT